MTWLRLDDGFTGNTKISQLSDPDFRVWMRLLCHCSRVKDPTVDKATRGEVAGLTTARTKRFAELGLLDAIAHDYEVHHWSQYLPADEQNAARQARWRARKRNGGVTQNVTHDVTAVTAPSRERTRARGPSRTQEQEQPHPPTALNYATDGRDETTGAPTANGRVGGWGSEQIGDTAKATLERLTTADEEEPF